MAGSTLVRPAVMSEEARSDPETAAKASRRAGQETGACSGHLAERAAPMELRLAQESKRVRRMQILGFIVVLPDEGCIALPAQQPPQGCPQSSEHSR